MQRGVEHKSNGAPSPVPARSSEIASPRRGGARRANRMNRKTLTAARVRQLLSAATKTQTLVVGDVMLDHFIWGSVARISPEAPVPVVEFERESFMPGGAANVARNLAALNAAAELYGVVGRDGAANQLKVLLAHHHIGCRGLLGATARSTSVKPRIVAYKEQVVRIDRETSDG